MTIFCCSQCYQGSFFFFFCSFRTYFSSTACTLLCATLQVIGLNMVSHSLQSLISPSVYCHIAAFGVMHHYRMHFNMLLLEIRTPVPEIRLSDPLLLSLSGRHYTLGTFLARQGSAAVFGSEPETTWTQWRKFKTLLRLTRCDAYMLGCTPY